MERYDLTKEWLTDVHTGLHKNTPIMMHLNDSYSDIGSGLDRHAPLLKGNIWGNYKSGRGNIADSGLMAILEWADENDINLILERDENGLANDLAIISKLGFFSED
jgi:endonuclease IV